MSAMWKRSVFIFILIAAVTGCQVQSGQIENNNAASSQPSPAQARDDDGSKSKRLAGKVVHISDGDTFVMEDEQGVRTTVRIHAIDAPELAQEFGKESRENLRALIANQSVKVRRKDTDQFQRIVGQVILNGTDVGLEQVKGGFAWHFKQYAKEQPADDRAAYAAAEEKAKTSRLGLWHAGSPPDPQSYRRTRGTRR